ncbi:MAG: C13 family peptidase [Candidatus Latescibacterota bacterium]|jgi:hypothetical protein
MTGQPARRCLLLAGGLDPARNYPRYGHELLWWGERLGKAGFECRACLGDGTAPEPVPSPIRLASARRAEVIAALGWLSALGETDLGLLVVSNHGDRSGICLWGPDLLTCEELMQVLSSAKGTLVLVMGQCHAGVFGPLAGPKVVVLTACADDERSWACPAPPGLVYDEFLYQLGTALFSAPADAPQPAPARRPLSLQDAFHWARAQDRRQTPPAQETPMIFDPAGLAPGITL